MKKCLFLLILASLAILSVARFRPFDEVDLRGSLNPELRHVVMDSPMRYNPSRILGGSAVSDSRDVPYLALVFLWMWPWCSGTIIGRRHILTVAHCKPVNTIYLSTMYVNRDDFVSSIWSFTTHPQFNRVTFDHDVAVITTITSITYDEYIAPVALARSNNLPPGATLNVYGYFKTLSRDTKYYSTIYQVDLPLWDRSTCIKIYPMLPESTLCIGGTPEGGKGACEEDVGGPAVYQGVQYGIASFYHDCGKANLPAYYTDVASVYSWIESVATLG